MSTPLQRLLAPQPLRTKIAQWIKWHPVLLDRTIRFRFTTPGWLRQWAVQTIDRHYERSVLSPTGEDTGEGATPPPSKIVHRKSLKRSLLILGVLGALVVNSPGMDRLSALGMLETGNNDHARGRRGEVSRYQILPRLWQQYGHGNPFDPRNARDAVSRIMRRRILQFERLRHCAPTNFDYYVMWNAPAQVGHPDATVADRAQRFANLCQR